MSDKREIRVLIDKEGNKVPIVGEKPTVDAYRAFKRPVYNIKRRCKDERKENRKG